MIQPVDLTIHQNWNKVRSLYQSILAKKEANTFPNKNFLETGQAKLYNIGSYGSLIYEDSDMLSKDWGNLTGKILYQTLPWFNHAQRIFADLNFYSCNWSVGHTNIRRHCDGKPDKESSLSFCNLNFIVSCEDPTAVTLSYDASDPNIVSSYPSKPNTAWLLDPNLPHEVKNSGLREILQFKFLNSYDNVAKFLNQTGPIVFG